MKQLFKPIDNKSLSLEVAREIELSLIEYGYSQYKVAFIASIVCATVIFIAFYSTENVRTSLFIWFGIFLFIAVVRSGLLVLYSRFKSQEKYPVFWFRLFSIGSFFGGLSWGLIAIMLFPFGNPFQQTLSILVLAGVTAGSITTLSAMPIAAIGYLVISIAPFIINIFFIKHFIYELFDITLLAYLIFMIVLSLRVYRMLKNLIYLQFENDELIKDMASINRLLENMATHDPLTHLDNNRLFHINLENAIKRAEREKKSLALLFLDLDNFKAVNDTYGHDIGNKLLLIIADRLRNALRKSDQLARLGGDEFTVIIEDADKKEDIRLTAKKLIQVLSSPVQIGGAKINTSVSIGISIYPHDGKDSQTLLRNADQAMYYVKKHGRNKFHFKRNKRGSNPAFN